MKHNKGHIHLKPDLMAPSLYPQMQQESPFPYVAQALSWNPVN